MEEGWLRFDSYSGDTHLISPLARFVLELIEESSSAISAPVILNRVLLVESDADPTDCFVEVEATLQLLSEAKLIEKRLDCQRPESD